MGTIASGTEFSVPHLVGIRYYKMIVCSIDRLSAVVAFNDLGLGDLA